MSPLGTNFWREIRGLWSLSVKTLSAPLWDNALFAFFPSYCGTPSLSQDLYLCECVSCVWVYVSRGGGMFKACNLFLPMLYKSAIKIHEEKKFKEYGARTRRRKMMSKEWEQCFFLIWKSKDVYDIKTFFESIVENTRILYSSETFKNFFDERFF